MHGRLSNWRWCCQSASRFGLEAPELRPRGLEGSRRGVERYLQLAAATTTTGSSARGTIMRWLRAFLHPVYRCGTVHAEPYEVRCKVTANPSKLSARDLQAAAAVRRPATRGGCYSYFFFSHRPLGRSEAGPVLCSLSLARSIVFSFFFIG